MLWRSSPHAAPRRDRKSTRLNSSHLVISYAVFCLKKKNISAKTFSQSEWPPPKYQGYSAQLFQMRPESNAAESEFFYSSPPDLLSYVFFFNDTATTEIYTLSLHDALPIFRAERHRVRHRRRHVVHRPRHPARKIGRAHSELQSPCNLVCRLLLEKKKTFTDAGIREAGEDPSYRCVIGPTVAW